MTVVIVGAGQAGATAAAELREVGFTDPIVLIGAEDEHPYERPPLSKGYLQGDDSQFAPIEVPDDVDLRLGVSVTAVDADARTVTAGGETIAWDALLIATGVEPLVLDLPGADTAFYLREHGDSARLRAALQDATSVIVVGGSWLGLEAAAAARQAGAAVTVVTDQPQLTKLGPVIGGIYQAVHEEHGVRVMLSADVARVLVEDGRAVGIEFADGSTETADVVVMSVGSKPRLDLARAAGCAIDEATNGVAVDGSLKTSVPGVWAAGDIASIDNPVSGKRARVEHWALALDGAKIAAHSIAGAPRDVVDFLPFFFSDQFDFSMEIAGGADPNATIVFRGSTAPPREFIAFWQVDDGSVVAAMNANVWDVSETLQALIASKRPVDRARLEDPSVPLEDL
jgi:3-phenylpropionate/trans-cinnamate dioxygenase ferredoxin reductase component